MNIISLISSFCSEEAEHVHAHMYVNPGWVLQAAQKTPVEFTLFFFFESGM